VTDLPQAADDAGAWTSEHWEDLFPQLGSYDFAREAFRAGAAAERERWLARIAGYRLGARLGGRFCHPADVQIIWKETP